MIEQHLSGMKARNGTTLFACSTCKTAPTFTFGMQDSGGFVYVMLCPTCGIVLGEWSSAEARDDELRSLATILRTRAKSHSGVK
jgi:hypothetical protein